VLLDMSAIHRASDIAGLVNIPHLAIEAGVVSDTATVPFAMRDVDGIEADQRRPQSDIGLGQAVSGPGSAARRDELRSCRASRTPRPASS
jgi:hypothetical protein